MEDDTGGGGGDGEAVQIGPRGEISSSCALEPSGRSLFPSKRVSYVHVNYRERRGGKYVGTKEAQVFPELNQVNGLHPGVAFNYSHAI